MPHSSHIILSWLNDLTFENAECFCFASRDTTTSVTAMLKRSYLWVTEITLPEKASLGGHIEKPMSPSASEITHKKVKVTNLPPS